MYGPEQNTDTGRIPTDALLDRFLAGLAPFAPVAVWAYGSLGGGDYQEGRSDLDPIAVLPRPARPATARTAWRLGLLHASLRAEPLAGLLHCTYLSPGTAVDPEQRHLTWARTGSSSSGRSRRSPGMNSTASDVSCTASRRSTCCRRSPDPELTRFVVRDQRDFWRPVVRRAELWRQDDWIDLVLLTFARATSRCGRAA